MERSSDLSGWGNELDEMGALIVMFQGLLYGDTYAGFQPYRWRSRRSDGYMHRAERLNRALPAWGASIANPAGERHISGSEVMF